jgi:hypothetical protein
MSKLRSQKRAVVIRNIHICLSLTIHEMLMLKSFCRQTYRQTKTYMCMPLIFRYGGIKSSNQLILNLNKMCYETQVPPHEANSRGGHHRQNPWSRCQNIKVLSKGACIWNTKALSRTIQKIWPMLKFLKSDWLIDYILFYVPLKNSSLIWRRLWKVGPTSRSKKSMPIESSCHKEHTWNMKALSLIL